MKNTLIGIGVLILILGVIYYIDEQRGVHDAPTAPRHAVDSMHLSQEEKAQRFPKYRELIRPQGFVNTDGITIGDQIGKKVVLLDIMTYSCINCQRTFPYLNAWYDKYKDQGFEIIGIHTPEFEFEKDLENVREALVDRYGIKFPVALDNDYETWDAYNNRYWPRKYLVDIDGYIVYDHIGEGAYDETEKKIQELLMERKDRLNEDIIFEKDVVEPQEKEVVNPFVRRSPETYFGLLRNQNLGIVESAEGELVTFSEPEEVDPSRLYLVGTWRLTGEFAEAVSPNAKIVYKYQAQKVFLVASSDEEVGVAVRVDGKSVSEDQAGIHVENGSVNIQNEQLYRFIEDRTHSERTLEVIIPEPGVRFFAFTFG